MYLALLASSEGAAGAPMSPFEVNFGLFFWTWIVFAFLLFILSKFAFGPITAAVEAREKALEDFNKAIEINTNLVKVYKLRSDCYYMLDRPEDADRAGLRGRKLAQAVDRAVDGANPVQEAPLEEGAPVGTARARHRQRVRGAVIQHRADAKSMRHERLGVTLVVARKLREAAGAVQQHDHRPRLRTGCRIASHRHAGA